MLCHQLMSAELYYEFRKLSRGIELTVRSSLKIGHFFMKKAKMLLGQCFMEPPKLWEKIGPDRLKEFEAQKEHRPYIHPPSGLQLK